MAINSAKDGKELSGERCIRVDIINYFGTQKVQGKGMKNKCQQMEVWE